MLYTDPVLVSLLTWRLLGQWSRRLGGLELGLALTGCLLVLGSPAASAGQALDQAGVAWALGGKLIYSFYIIASERHTAGVPSPVASTYIITAAAIGRV